MYLLRERTGLIAGPGTYSFSHKSIAEYLVAELILEGNVYSNTGTRIDRFYLFQQRNNDRWNTVTFLWAGIAPLIELENFIIECIAAQIYDLGYGLLYDQFERLSPEFSTETMTSLLSRNNSNLFKGNYRGGWAFGYPNIIQEQDLNEYYLRSLGSITGINNLIMRSVEENYLDINILNIISKELKINFLMIIISHTKKIEDLYSLLNEENIINDPYWIFIKIAIFTNRIIINELDKEIIKNINHKNQLYIHIINIINISLYTESIKKYELYKKLKNIYVIYSYIENIDKNKEILLLTRCWNISYLIGHKRNHEIDLLIDTSLKLKGMRYTYNDDTDNIIDKLITIIDNLRSQRDNLIKEASE